MYRSYFYDFFTKITHLDSPVACLDLLFRYICIYTHVPISCFIMQLLIFGSMCTHISTFANPWAVGQNNIAVESSFIFIWMDNEIQEPKNQRFLTFFLLQFSGSLMYLKSTSLTHGTCQWIWNYFNLSQPNLIHVPDLPTLVNRFVTMLQCTYCQLHSHMDIRHWIWNYFNLSQPNLT